MASTLAWTQDHSGGRHAGAPGRALPPPVLMPAVGLRGMEGDALALGAIVHIVDLDEVMQERLSRLFASVGVEARAYADVGAFVNAEQPDLAGCLIVHARLSLVGELEFLAHLQRPAARLPIVVIADHASVRTAVLAMKAGAIDILETPLRDRDMLEAVGDAIRIDGARRSAEARHTELRAQFATLTRRERQVMALVTQGWLNKQVAGKLGLSEITVKVHRGSAMRKMCARTLPELVRMADAIADLADPQDAHGVPNGAWG